MKPGITYQYVYFGIIFGLLFPITASIIQCYQVLGTVTLKGIWIIQSNSPLLWIIDASPFILGLFSYVAGRNHKKIKDINLDLTQRVKDQTVGISSVNQALRNEIEERKKREVELREAKKDAEEGILAKEQFLSNMSHEIRTPMNGILGMTDVLLNTPLSAEQRKHLSAIDYSAKNLLVIINDILDLSKINAEKIEFEKTNFRIMDVVQSVENTLKFKANDKGIQFNLIVDKKVPDVMSGDPVRLSQILLNIAGNAVKFTEKGAVDVSCKLEGENEDGYRIVVIVKDTGIGIPKEKVSTIFENFSQGGAKITNKFGGTGLGLPISKKLIELQGGELSVESNEGKGSTFSFSLQYGYPDVSEEENSSLESKIDVSKVENSSIKILLVEDNKINQMVAKSFLDRFGFKVNIVENGLEAIEALKEEEYDIVLMDVQMPKMDGLEATRYIRQNLTGPNRDVKIIAMTASVLKKEIDKCFDAGMDEYIPKPFDPKELFEKIVTMVYTARFVA